MKLRRIVLGGLGLLITIVFIAAAAAVWVITTESGSRFALARAQAAAGGAFSVGGISGRLSEAVVLSDLALRGTGWSVAIERLEIDPDWSQLLAGTVTIERLASSIVRVHLEPAGGPAASGEADSTSVPRLPIAIQLARASVEGIVIERPDGELATERLTLSGAAAGTLADVRRLETRAQGFYLSVQGQFDWSDGLGLDAVLSWSGDLLERNWLGSVHLAGTLSSLAVEQQLLEPFDLSATGAVSLTPQPRVNLMLQWTDLTVPGYETMASAAGSAEIVGGIDDFGVRIDSDLGRLSASGGLDLDSLRFMLALDASNIALSHWLESLPGLYSVRGNLEGRLGSDYVVASDDLTLAAEVAGQTIDGAFAGTVEDGEVSADRIEIELGGNRMTASGRIGPMLDLEVGAELGELERMAELARSDEIAALAEIDPRVFALRGNASANLTVTGDWRSPAIRGDLRLTDARYFDLPFGLAASLGRRPDDPSAYAIESLEATLGATSLTVNGSVGSELDLALEARVGDLGEVAALLERDEIRSVTGFSAELAPLAGRADLRLALTGDAGRPAITADLTVLDLSYDRLMIDRAVADVDFDTAPGGRADLSISADAPNGSLMLAAAGRFGEKTWRGRLESLTIQEPVLGAWRLENPADLELGTGLVDLASSCLRNVSSSVCVHARYGTSADALELSADAFDLETIAPVLPSALSLAGLVDVEVTMTGLSAESPQGSLSVRSRGAEVGFGSGQLARRTTIDSLAVDAELSGYALSLSARLEGPATGSARLSMSSADVRDSEAPINGSLDVVWSDLSAAAALTPDVGTVGGTLEAALNVSGSTRNPRVEGSAHLGNGSVSIPQWGVAIDRIDGDAMSPDGRSLQFSGVGFIEDGELRLSGVTELDPDARWPTRFRLTGMAVPVVQRPDITVVASPDLEIVVALPNIEVTGDVVVPSADIKITALPTQAVRVSPDAVVHGREVVAAQRPIQLHANIGIELGDDVHYSDANLRTELTGNLRLNYQSGLSPTAAGNVGVTGTYEAYGQQLQLERGQLLFAGPLTNPGLDIRAVRRVGSVTAGIHLGGTLLAPESTVFSEPPMREADALAYVLFGRPFEASDEEKSQALEATALTLGLQQALPVVQRVGDTLGLDELTIGASDVDASALMAGKYLSPKVYLSYTYGLFNRLGGFLLRYDINDRFSLETRSGNEKSMDLLYTVEKN